MPRYSFLLGVRNKGNPSLRIPCANVSFALDIPALAVDAIETVRHNFDVELAGTALAITALGVAVVDNPRLPPNLKAVDDAAGALADATVGLSIVNLAANGKAL